MTNNNKIKKMYGVVWSEIGRKEYDIPKTDYGLINLDYGILYNANRHGKGRPKLREATVYPIFDTEREAESFRKGNPDFRVVELKVYIN